MNRKINTRKISSLEVNELLQFYMNRGIISPSDMMSCSEDTIMNKILKKVHPYKIYFSTSDERWHTQVEDPTNVRGYRQIVRKKAILKRTLLTL